MNIKAERIEQLIQLVNRNLSLLASGQPNGVSAFEYRKLQRVDAVIFGHDKFAYEMVHFVNSFGENPVKEDSLKGKWEGMFIKGLESLLVECAVIHDEIERECFVSRVYCWFTEKITERREMPRDLVDMEDLRNSVSRLSINGNHTMKGLNNFDPESTQEHRKKLLENEDTLLATTQIVQNENEAEDLFPPINQSTKKSKKHPMYVKHAYPSVIRNTPDLESSFLPKIPGAEENYGMLYNKPETEAEKKMNDLWLARRRQEAFEYKTQQQMAIVMDRLALHKARVESESLRRQESERMLKMQKNRPASANDALTNDTQVFRPSTEHTERSRRGIIFKLRRDASESPASSPDRSRSRNRRNKANSSTQDDASSNNVGDMSLSPQSAPSSRKSRIGLEEGTNITVTGKSGDKESIVSAPGRTVVTKQKKDFKPMRFKIDLPDGYAERQQYYMQLSDSEDEKEDKSAPRNKTQAPTTGQGKGKNSKKAANQKTTEIQFKHDKPEIRERPHSAKVFRDISMNDPEFKVLYRFTNYRRMPLTTNQEHWIEDREQERVKKAEEMAKELFSKSDKKKDKGKDKGKDAKADKKDKKDKKGKGKDGKGAESPEKPPPKYKSAGQFMEKHFPTFENDESLETMGPMRTMQLMEVANIMETFDQSRIAIKESALRKALVVPQDKPEAICLENLPDNKEGLMVNPNPIEYWKKFVMKKSKGGKKKKK